MLYYIDSLQKEDIEDVIKLCSDKINSSISPYREHISERQLISQRKRDLKNLWKYYNEGTVGCYVAKENNSNKVIGTIIFIKEMIDPLFFQKQVWIVDISVKKQFQRKGIATNLLKKVFQFAKENNLKYIVLEVTSSNKGAINLYEKLGFKEERRRYIKKI